MPGARRRRRTGNDHGGVGPAEDRRRAGQLPAQLGGHVLAGEEHHRPPSRLREPRDPRRRHGEGAGVEEAGPLAGLIAVVASGPGRPGDEEQRGQEGGGGQPHCQQLTPRRHHRHLLSGQGDVAGQRLAFRRSHRGSWRRDHLRPPSLEQGMVIL
ncbi:MAG: hypothetical protein CYG61_06430 [Actinobacteria bacterium]|nr:MAG: hypothetical protein CYG61_06430 [Actinomycetota bacterium]